MRRNFPKAVDSYKNPANEADEDGDVGEDGETPVVEDCGIPAPYKFTGKIDKVTIDVKEMKTADKEKADMARKEYASPFRFSDTLDLVRFDLSPQ